MPVLQKSDEDADGESCWRTAWLVSAMMRCSPPGEEHAWRLFTNARKTARRTLCMVDACSFIVLRDGYASHLGEVSGMTAADTPWSLR